MAHLGERRPWSRTLAAPLALSLAVHGLLLAGLWLCPARSDHCGRALLDTRVTMEACLLDLASPPGDGDPRSRDEPPGEVVHVEPLSMPPRMIDPPLPAPPLTPDPSPPRGEGRKTAPLSPDARGVAPLPPLSPRGRGVGGEGDGRGLFPLAASVASVVYVIDRSVSMGEYDKLDLAKRELLAGLRRLPATTRFQVIAYNVEAEPLVINGQAGLLPAEPAIIEEVARLLADRPPSGGTRHAGALRRGLLLHPEVLYFLTDADDLAAEDVQTLTRINQGQPSPTAIHTVELTRRRAPRRDGPLAQLARDNRGTYTCRQVGVWTSDRVHIPGAD